MTVFLFWWTFPLIVSIKKLLYSCHISAYFSEKCFLRPDLRQLYCAKLHSSEILRAPRCHLVCIILWLNIALKRRRRACANKHHYQQNSFLVNSPPYRVSECLQFPFDLLSKCLHSLQSDQITYPLCVRFLGTLPLLFLFSPSVGFQHKEGRAHLWTRTFSLSNNVCWPSLYLSRALSYSFSCSLCFVLVQSGLWVIRTLRASDRVCLSITHTHAHISFLGATYLPLEHCTKLKTQGERE